MLNISHNDIGCRDAEPIKLVSTAIGMNINIHTLNVAGSNLQHLCDAISSLPKLSKLDISSCRYYGTYDEKDAYLYLTPEQQQTTQQPGLMNMCKIIKASSVLADLAFSGENCSAVVRVTVDSTELDCRGKFIGGQGAALLAAFMPKCIRLRTLDLYECNLDGYMDGGHTKRPYEAGGPTKACREHNIQLLVVEVSRMVTLEKLVVDGGFGPALYRTTTSWHHPLPSALIWQQAG